MCTNQQKAIDEQKDGDAAKPRNPEEMHIHSFQISTPVKVSAVPCNICMLSPFSDTCKPLTNLRPTRWCATDQRLHGSEMISGQDFTTGDGVGVAAEVGHLPLGGQVQACWSPLVSSYHLLSQVEKGPFFTGDSSNKKKLAPLDTSAGVRGVLDQHADRTFNRPSVQIDAQGIKWNYGDLKAHVDATATGLLELGVQKGDTIALWANSPAEKLLTELSAAVLGVSLVEAKSASALSGAKVIVFDGSDSAAAAAVGAASGVKLQTAGAPVAGLHPIPSNSHRD